MNTIIPRSTVIRTSIISIVILTSTVFVLLSPKGTHAAVTLTPLSSQLDVGSTGKNVMVLQTFLATDSHVYPQGFVTGYYGPLTRNAVAQFQIGYGLPPAGRVGPLTLELINQMIGNGDTTVDVTAPIVSDLQVATTSSSATITWSTNEEALGSVHYDTLPISYEEVSTAHQEPRTSGTLVAEQISGTSHSVTITGLMSGHTYYFGTESRDATGNITVTLSQSFTTSF